MRNSSSPPVGAGETAASKARPDQLELQPEVASGAGITLVPAEWPRVGVDGNLIPQEGFRLPRILISAKAGQSG